MGILMHLTCAYTALHHILARALSVWPVLTVVGKLMKKHFGDWGDIILPLTLSLNDTQLVSTLAFLIAGLIQLDQGITVYHFSIVVNLAWMASATQLVGFMVMILWVQKVGQGSKIPHPYLPMRIMRSVLITTEFALLARVSYIQGNRDWDDSYGCPVRCLSENVRDIGGPPSRWMIANFVLLAWTLIDSIALLFKRTREQLEGLYEDIEGL